MRVRLTRYGRVKARVAVVRRVRAADDGAKVAAGLVQRGIRYARTRVGQRQIVGAHVRRVLYASRHTCKISKFPK